MTKFATWQSFGILPESHHSNVDDRKMSSKVHVVDRLRIVSDVLEDQMQLGDGVAQDVDMFLNDVVAHGTVCQITQTSDVIGRRKPYCS